MKTKAIVLYTLKLGDDKLIVDFLTCGGERLSCVAFAGRTARSAIRRHTLQPMSIMDIEYGGRADARLKRLRGARIAMPLGALCEDAGKLSAAMFVSELLRHATVDEHTNPALYTYVERSMRWLDQCASPAPNFHIVFMLGLTRFIGFFPNVEGYSEGDVFDMRQACFTHKAPPHGDYIDTIGVAVMLNLMRMDYATMSLFRMSHAERTVITDTILRYYRLHVPGFPAMRSLPVLKQLWE